MDFGDVPAWAALVVAVVAAELSRRAHKISTRNVAAAERAAEAAERSTAAAENALALQQQDAAVRQAAEAEAARPKVRLRIDFAGKHNYRLRNWGDATADNVVNAEPCGAVDAWPTGLTLRPSEAHHFMIAGDFDDLEPAQIHVKWDGQGEPVVLPVP